MPYQFLAAPLSLYSGKVRGYLRWKNIPYREILANRDIYEHEIVRRVGYPIIPVLLTPNDETIQDTTDIIDYLENHEPGPSVYPDGDLQKLVALIFDLFGDEYLVIAAMHYRWAYNKEYAWGQFGKTLIPDAPYEHQVVAGEKAAAKFMGFLPMLGITEKTMPEIERGYEVFLAAFQDHLANHKFLLGSRPSIGDYGLLGPLYAHNYRDPASGAMMEKRAPRVACWCRYTHAPQHPLFGRFVDHDEIPYTLIPLLNIFVRDHLPILVDTARLLTEWAKDKPSGTEVPRAIGVHEVQFGAVQETRAVLPYSLWMFQRIQDHLAGLQAEAKADAAKLLLNIQADAILDMPTFPRLERKNFKLVLA